MFSSNEIENIKREMGKLKNTVVLKLFTDFKTETDGSKNRNCAACQGTYTLLRTLEEYSNGKLKIEEYSIVENKDISKKYDVTRIPAIIFTDEDDKEVIRYSTHPTGAEFVPFLNSIQYFSGVRPFYEDQILTNLKKIPKSQIKIFITQTCPYCPQTVPVLTLFAIVSKGKLTVDVIDVDLNPEIAIAYQVQGVPHTVINEKENIYGMFTPQDLLDALTKGQRDFGGMYA
ncbi:MAG: thioredoxin family protein [Promethearchaeota archaeon]